MVDALLARNDDRRGLEAAVDELAAVSRVERGGDLRDDARRALGVEPARALELGAQVDSLDQLGRDVQDAAQLVGLVDRGEVRMPERLGELGVAHEALLEARRLRDARRDQLERDLAAPRG